MCVIVHRIGNEWNIQKQIVNFIHVEGQHTSEKLSIPSLHVS